MASKFHRGGSGFQMQKAFSKEQTNRIIKMTYAAFVCELWDRGWEVEEIRELFADTQARWKDSQMNGWDMFQNVKEVTGFDFEYFRKTGDVV